MSLENVSKLYESQCKVVAVDAEPNLVEETPGKMNRDLDIQKIYVLNQFQVDIRLKRIYIMRKSLQASVCVLKSDVEGGLKNSSGRRDLPYNNWVAKHFKSCFKEERIPKSTRGRIPIQSDELLHIKGVFIVRCKRSTISLEVRW